MRNLYLSLIITFLPFLLLNAQDFDVLVFSKTEGFRHGSIAAGINMIETLGADHNFSVDASEDSNLFTEANLEKYEAVIFLNTTGDILNSSQENAFESYISNGGGFVGIHAATDTEYGWEWYGGLVGAYFANHPPGTTEAAIRVSDRVHPSTEDLPFNWNRIDEWYNFQENPRGEVHVLATVDEQTYNGGSMGFDHPVSWCQEYEGGRSWYTALGHTNESYEEDFFKEHVLGGIRYAAGQVLGDFEATVDQNMETSIIVNNPVNPLALTVLPDLRVMYIERAGKVNLYDPATGIINTIAVLGVDSNREDGLLGITLDPNFASNQLVYLFYSPSGPEAKQHVSRFTFTNDVLDLDSEEILLEIPVQRATCCHSGGDLEFDGAGNLYISTGDNTNPFESDGFTPIDERPGRENYDAQGTSANTHDLRGKILRIKPEADGSYSIPDGNLFATADEGLPEIYVMGARNPFRIALSQDGELYFGDIGPDSWGNNSLRGPRGHDEFNRTKVAGNFGWPYAIADNQVYRDYDFSTGNSADFYDSQNPFNDSPNNTGNNNLPPSIPAWLYYSYSDAYIFPAMEAGTGTGRSAMAGAIYNYDANSASNIKFPAYYDQSVFIYEWARNWVHEIRLDDQGEMVSINPFYSSLTLNRPIDMHFGPDGAMYLIEWGTGFTGNNQDARIVKVSFRKDGRTPVAIAKADKLSGALPLEIQFDGSESYDLDAANILTFEWDLDGDGTIDSNEESPSFIYTEAGNYDVILKLSDNTGLFSFTSLQVVAGNTAPVVNIDYPPNGGLFLWGEEIPYTISVEDEEDGTTANGDIACESITALPSIGHDDHSHDLIGIANCEGSFITNSHGDEADNVFYVLRGAYTDEGVDSLASIETNSSILLQPKKKEAEFYTSQEGVLTEITGDDLGGGINVGWISPNEWIAFDPISLEGITHVTFRCASAGAGGWIELRLNAPDGTKVGERIIPVTGDWQRWDYFSLPITSTEGTHELYVVFKNDNTNNDLLNLNWIEFHGKGVALRDSFELRGLKGSYFNSTNFSGDPKIVKDPMLAFNWESRAPLAGINEDGFSVIWESNIVVEQTGTYSLFAEHEGGSLSVLFDGAEVINNPNAGSASSSSQFLTAGVLHPVTVLYVHDSGNASVKLGFGEWETIHMSNYHLEESIVVAIDEVEEDELAIKVFPNPFDESFNVSLPENLNINLLTLYSLDGKEIQSWTWDEHNPSIRLKVEALKSGTYVLKLSGGEKSYYKKLVHK